MDRENMLVKLQEIIKKYTAEKRATLLDLDTIVSEDSVYSPGKAGLVQKSSSSSLDLFRKEARKVAASITMKPLEIPDNTIIPKARHIASESLFDVETGTSLVFSSSQDQEEAVPEEEKEDEQQDAGGSSSTEESDAKPEKQPSVASIPSSTRATSVVSVKSDLQKVVEEGEGEIDEGEEEDLEIAFFY